MAFTPSQVANACRFWAPNVSPLAPSIAGMQLLWGLSGNESSFGKNVTPRHEPAYDVGGALAGSPEQAALLEKYGSVAACSYGPWQIMLVNAPEGTAPADFEDLNTAALCTVGFLNSQLRRFKPLTLTTIGQIWNAGHPLSAMSAGVAAYVAQLAKNYDVPMLEETA